MATLTDDKVIDLRSRTFRDILIDANRSWNIVFDLRDPVNEQLPYSVAGATITMNIKKNINDTEFIQQLSVGNGITIIGDNDNLIAITPENRPEGRYVYDLDILETNGKIMGISGSVKATNQNI